MDHTGLCKPDTAKSLVPGNAGWAKPRFSWDQLRFGWDKRRFGWDRLRFGWDRLPFWLG